MQFLVIGYDNELYPGGPAKAHTHRQSPITKPKTP
jgi:hypothetical protein